MPLTITQFFVGGLDNNCTYICSDADGRTTIIDPTGDIAQVLDYCSNHRLTIEAIWLTHTHFDHIDQIPTVQEVVGPVPIYVHAAGVKNLAIDNQSPVHELTDGQELCVGKEVVKVLHTPGHSPDGICFYYAGGVGYAPWLLSGDTLFINGCGRTTPDNALTLYQSLQRLKDLPHETIVYPGHDYGPAPYSTLGIELEENRFLRASTYEEFYAKRFPDAV